MQHLKGFLPKDLPLRPLLLAGGAAVTAVGVYYFMKKKKKCDDEKNTAEDARTSASQDPVQVSEEDSWLDYSSSCDNKDGVSSTQTHRAAPKKGPLAETKRKYKREKECSARLRKENSEQMSRINTLQASVKELGNLLCECNIECTETSKLYEVEKNLRKHLEANFEKMDEKHDKKINLVRVKLAETERKFEEVMEINAQLQEELFATRLRCDKSITKCEENNRELNVLKSEYTELKENVLKCPEPEVKRMLLSQKEELKDLYEKEALLKVTAADAERKYEQEREKCEQMMDSNAQLENAKSELMSEVNTLRGAVQQLERELSETRNKCEETKRERESEAHDILKQLFNQATSHNERSRNGTETEGKSELVVFTNAKLESEKLVLMEKVNTLQKMLEGLTNLLSQTRQKCSKAVTEQAVMKGVHKFEMSKAKKRECVLRRKKKSLMVALEDSGNTSMELVESLEEAERVNIQLETEKNELSQHLDTVRELLVNAERITARCEELTEECRLKDQQLSEQNSRLAFLANTIIPDLDKECEAHSRLKAQHDELKQQYEELLKEREQTAHGNLESKDDRMKETPTPQQNFQVTLDEAEEEYQPVMESSTQMDNESSDMMSHLDMIESLLQQMEEQLCEEEP